MSDIIACPSCGASNRVPQLAAGKKAVCGRCKAPLNGSAGHPVTVTDATFDAVINDGRPTVVDFWAAWCGPCRMIAPVLDEIASQRTDIRVAKLNVDENPRTSVRFGVQGIPLLVFFKGGAEVGRVTGAVPKSQLDLAISQYLGG